MAKKIFAFPIIRLSLILGGFVVLASLLQRFAHGKLHSPLAIEAILCLLLFPVAFVIERYCAGKTVADVGFPARDAFSDGGKGFLLGGALFVTVVAVLALSRCYGATFNTWSGIPEAALFFLIVAFFEEFLFRGVIFRIVEEMTGTWIAVAISAALFGALHAGNPGATVYSTLAIAIEAGVLLALAFALTRSLWFAIGIHWAWNFFEGPVFGTQVSGGAGQRPLLLATIHGPAWLTGGNFGPEAGVLPIVLCMLVAVPIAIQAVRRGNVVRPMWKVRT